MDRVKFYSKEDWACGGNLKKLEEVLIEFDETKNYDIVDIIEFYNCIKYIENECYLQTWESDYIEEVKAKMKVLNKVIACFLFKINDSNIINIIEKINYTYKEDFWEMIDKYKVYSRISDVKFDEILKNNHTLGIISDYKNIVKHYGNIIREHLLKYEESAIILLDKYEIVREHSQKQIYLPDELTGEDKEKILINYIEAENPNINYLRVIFNMQSTKEMPISDKTRLMAKRKIKEETEKIFSKDSGITMETIVTFAKNLPNEREEVLKGQNLECTYSIDWLKNNKDYPIRLENIVEWFFKEYLLNEFNVNDYRINVPSEESNYLEKCRTTLSELDNILKEYRLLVEDNTIDHELLQISSRPIPFNDVPSKVKNKYIYPDSEEYNLISALFFSNQCMLAYIPKLEEKYDNFFNVVKNEKVKIEDYPEYEHYHLNTLISKQYLEVDENGYLKFKNIERIIIFRDLNYNEVVCYWKYPIKYRIEIDKMLSEGILKSESTLFSKPEIDYLNYYLNKSEFNNGLDIRNMYIHGTQPNDNESEKIHETNYMRILKIFILAIIKINDDLTTYYDNEE